MSDIPKARAILQELMADPNVGPNTKKQIGRALGLMIRVKYVRRVPAKPRIIDRALRRAVRLLAQSPDMTIHEIANRVGLRNSGRVSEILHGKR